MRTILAATAVFLAMSAAAVAQQTDAPKPYTESGISVPGVIDRPVPPPAGDPRTPARRMRDIRSWDKCVLAAQRNADADPLRPQMDTPEDYCRGRLGMASRQSVPFDAPQQ
ncbi:MAG: hypothetical protein JNJ73_08480 [Hyphomonadaceae bacterium]|nr:hypothetical protein [Hyphomonadaceae bacterium]